MGWATWWIELLLKGYEVSFKPHGNSMQGKIASGQRVTVSPKINDLRVGDIVLCKVKGKEYLHLIKAIQDNRYQIGNNKGHINGWIGKNSIYGRVIKIGD